MEENAIVVSSNTISATETDDIVARSYSLEIDPTCGRPFHYDDLNPSYSLDVSQVQSSLYQATTASTTVTLDMTYEYLDRGNPYTNEAFGTMSLRPDIATTTDFDTNLTYDDNNNNISDNVATSGCNIDAILCRIQERADQLQHEEELTEDFENQYQSVQEQLRMEHVMYDQVHSQFLEAKLQYYSTELRNSQRKQEQNQDHQRTQTLQKQTKQLQAKLQNEMKQWDFFILGKNPATATTETARNVSITMTQDEDGYTHNPNSKIDSNATNNGYGNEVNKDGSINSKIDDGIDDSGNDNCFSWNHPQNRGILTKRRMASTFYESYMETAIDSIETKQQRKRKKQEILIKLLDKYTTEEKQLNQERDKTEKDIVSYQKHVAIMNPQIESLAQQIRLALAKRASLRQSLRTIQTAKK